MYAKILSLRDGQRKVVLVAKRDIAPGEEVRAGGRLRVPAEEGDAPPLRRQKREEVICAKRKR